MDEEQDVRDARRGTWKPGQSGNPAGKPPGTRNRATQMVLALMEGGAEEITLAIIDAARKGDMAAARLVLERLAPPARERPLSLNLPDTSTVAGVSEAQQAILQAVGSGELMPGEGTALAGILEARRKALETIELEQRISALETRMARIDARLQKLESHLHADKNRVLIVFREAGETTADAIRRQGHDPSAAGVRYVVVTWQTARDAVE